MIVFKRRDFRFNQMVNKQNIKSNFSVSPLKSSGNENENREKSQSDFERKSIQYF